MTPESRENISRSVRSLLLEGKHGEAIDLSVSLLKDDPEHAPSLQLMGETLTAVGNAKEAAVYLQKASEKFLRTAATREGGLLASLLALARNHANDLNFEEALRVYKKVTELYGEDWRILEKTADIYICMGDMVSAIDTLNRAYIIGSGNVVAIAVDKKNAPKEIEELAHKRNAFIKIAEKIGVCGIRKKNGWFIPRSDPMFEDSFEAAPIYKDRSVPELTWINECVLKSRQHRLAVDVGANIGMWSYVLADYFDVVESFEPLPRIQLCFSRNVTKPNVHLNKCALGAEPGKIRMEFVDFMCGASHVKMTSSDETADVNEGNDWFDVRRLDDLNLVDVDFVKIDTEGFESFVVRGGMETILRYKPVMYVEQFWGERYDGSSRYEVIETLTAAGATATQMGLDSNFLIQWTNQ